MKWGWKSVQDPLLTGLVGVESFRSSDPQPEWPFLAWRATTESYWHRLCVPADQGQVPRGRAKKALGHWGSCPSHCPTAGSGALGCHGGEGCLYSSRVISRLLLSRTSRRQLQDALAESATTSSGSVSPTFPLRHTDLRQNLWQRYSRT